MSRNFMNMARKRWAQGYFVSVGLDSTHQEIPHKIYDLDLARSIHHTIYEFNTGVVEATKDIVCAYKLNIAHYLKGGAEWQALQDTVHFIHVMAPEIPVIIDGKFGDIHSTNLFYARMAFDTLKADAITVHAAPGFQALRPFLDQGDKGIFVVCRMSGEGAGEMQDVSAVCSDGKTRPYYQYIAMKVAQEWNQKGNCGVVVGGTYPEELAIVRGIVGDMPILSPGAGRQGGDIASIVSCGSNSKGDGIIINSSRGIIFSESPWGETEKLHNLINQYR